jgi:hypothetical protein
MLLLVAMHGHFSSFIDNKRFTGRDLVRTKLKIYTLAVGITRPFAPAAIQADTAFFILATSVGAEDSC